MITKKRFRKTVSRTHKIFWRNSSCFVCPVSKPGNFCLVSLEKAWLSSVQLEAVRKKAKRKVKKNGVFFPVVSPFMVLTKKPSEMRMGKGKGKAKSCAAVVVFGSIIAKASHKFPLISRLALKETSS
jgi:large subunit ribosomal protein L16